MPLNPNAPVTAWVLLTFVVTVLTVGTPLLLGMLRYRRESRTGQQQDIATLVGPLIDIQIRTHNSDPFAHPVVLQKYPTIDTLNALKEQIAKLGSTIDSNEKQRKEDVRQFGNDMTELKRNVSRAMGRRSTDRTPDVDVFD